MAQNIKVSSYMKNVGKSMGYAVGDVFSKYNPTLSSIAKSSKETYRKARISMMEINTNSVSNATKSFTSSDNVFSNVIDDLKTGKWYNKEREDSLFDDWGDFGDEDWGDDDNYTSDTGKDIQQGTKEIMHSMGAMGTKLGVSFGKVSARSAEYIVKNNNAASKALYDLNRQGFNQVSNILLSMHGTIDGLAQMATPLNAHMQNSAIFFTNTTKTLNEMNESLSKLVKRTEYMDSMTPGGKRKKAKGSEKFMANGYFDMESYMEMVKDNVEDLTKRYEGLIDMAKMMIGKNGKNLSLVQMALVESIDSLVPKMMKEAMEGFNESLNNAFTIGLTRGGRSAKNSRNPLVRLLGNIFLPQLSSNAKFDTGNYNKGPTSWDGVARKSVVEVIPTYLARMVALLGGEEKYFDYEKGKFVSAKQLAAKHENTRNSYARAAGGEFRTQIINDIYNNSAITNKESVINEIEEFFVQAFINGDKVDMSYILDHPKQYNLSNDAVAYIKDTLKRNKTSPKSKIRNSANSAKVGIYKQRAAYASYLANEEVSGMSTLSNLNNDFGSMDEMVSTQTQYIKGIYELMVTENGGRVRNKSRRHSKTPLKDAQKLVYETNNRKNSNNTADAVSGIKDNGDEELRQEIFKADRELYIRDGVKYMSGGELRVYYGNWKRNNDIKEAGKGARDKIVTKVDKDGKIKTLLIKARSIYEQPFEQLSIMLNRMTEGINDFFWGDDNDEGIIDKFKNTIMKQLDPYLDPIKQKFKEYFSPISESIKNEWNVVKGQAKDFVGNMWYGKNRYAGVKAGRAAARESVEALGPGYSVGSNGQIILPEDYGSDESGYGSGLAGGKSGIKKIKNAARKAGEDVHRSFDDVGISGLLEDTAKTASRGGRKLLTRILYGNTERGNSEEESKKISETIGKTLKEIGNNQGAVLLGGLTGAGISVLTGAVVGPLAGAAIGAGIGLISKSEKVQEILFGKKPGESDEDYEKSFRADMKKFFQNNGIVNMGVTGTIGATAGLFMGSPTVGAIMGATVGYVASSERTQRLLFGEKDENGNRKGGVISKEIQDKIKKAAPNMTAGAIAGLIAGPFGVTGNIILGSAIGYMTTSNKFQEFMFGENGVADKISDIVHNLGNMVNGGVRRLGLRAWGLVKGIGEKVGSSLMNAPWVGKVLGGLVKGAKGILNTPARVANKVLGGVQTGLKKGNLRRGDAVYDRRLGRNLTAAERVSMRKTLKNGGVTEETDEFGNTHYYKVDINGNRKEIKKERYDAIAAKNATGNQKWANNIYSRVDESLAGMTDDQRAALAGMDDEMLNDTLVNQMGLDRPLSMIQLSNIKKQVKDEAKVINEKKEKQKAAQEADPNYKNISDIKSLIEKIAKKQGVTLDDEGIEQQANNRQYQTDLFGSVHAYTVNDDGSLEPANDDNATKESEAKVNKFTSAINNLPGIGAAVGGIGSALAFLKNGLLGNEEEGKKGILSGIFEFFTGGSSLSEVLSNPGVALKSVITKLIGPALLIGGLSGKFDGIAESIGKISLLRGNDTQSQFANNTSKQVTLSDGTKEYLQLDDDGNPVKDEDGNYISSSGESIDPSDVKKTDNFGTDTSFRKQLAKSIATKTILGQQSLVTKALGMKAIDPAKLASKGLISGVLSSVASALEKLPGIIQKIPFLPAGVKEGADTIATTLYSHIDDAAKAASTGVLAKAGKVLSNALVVLKVATVIAKGINAWGNAESILGITEEATTTQKVIAVLIAVANSLIPVIGDLIPNKTLVNIFMAIAPKLGLDVSDLAEQRANAEKEVEEFNKLNGTDLSIEEYNEAGWEYDEETGEYTQGKSRSGIFTRAKNKVKGWFSKDKSAGSGSGIAGSGWFSDLFNKSKAEASVKETATNVIDNVTSTASGAVKTALHSIISRNKSANVISLKVLDPAGNTVYDIAGSFNLGGFLSNMVKSIGSFITQLFESSGLLPELSSTDGTDDDNGDDGGSSGFVSQLDPKYKGYRVSGSSFANKGCGPAVAAMTARALGKNLSVGSAVSASSGYQTNNGVTIDYFQNALGRQGIDTQVIAGGGAGDIYNSIARGNKVVLLGRDPYNTSKANSPFGPNNHYVLATGLDRSGNVIVNDPENNGPRAYSPGILNSTKYGIAAGRSGIINRARNFLHSISGGGTPRKDSTTMQIWAFLINNLGMSKVAAAAIMGNMEQESGCDPTKKQTHGTAYGLCQWDGSRKTKLMSFPTYSQLATQLAYMAQELTDKSVTTWKSGGSKLEGGVTYTWNSMTYDEFKAMTDITKATVKFEAAFEKAGKPQFAKRIEYAKQYYSLFSGEDSSTWTYGSANNTTSDSGWTYGSANNPTSDSTWTYGSTDNGKTTEEEEEDTSKTEKKTSILGTLSSIGSIFSDAFNKAFNGETEEKDSEDDDTKTDDTSSTTTNSTTTTATDTNSYLENTDSSSSAIVNYMRSVLGQLKYDMNGPRNPEKGSADCSSTVKWAVEKATGINIGGNTEAQYENGNLNVIKYNGGSFLNNIPNNAKPGDILFFSRPTSNYTLGRKDRVGHVAVYEGNGRMIDHGGKGKGPNEKNVPLGQSGQLVKISRVAGTGSGLRGIRSYDEIANVGGASGLLLSSRAGSHSGISTIRDPRTGRLVPVKFAGGATGIADTTALLNGIASSAKSGKGISQDTVNDLIQSITALLGSIATNTAPIDKIYSALVTYMQSGGASGTTTVTPIKVAEKPKAQAVNQSGDVDQSIKTLAGVLAELAKG